VTSNQGLWIVTSRYWPTRVYLSASKKLVQNITRKYVFYLSSYRLWLKSNAPYH
jgi:hypothetical protein